MRGSKASCFNNLGKIDFHQLGPLGPVGLVVAKCVCVFVCLAPSHAIFFQAFHWPCDHKIRMRDLLIVRSQANIRNTFFDQSSPQHQEVGGLRGLYKTSCLNNL